MFTWVPFSTSMSDFLLTSTKTAPPPLTSVANTLMNQHHQKIEPIDYTADESMIADFMAVLPQLDPNDSSSGTISPLFKFKGQSTDTTKTLGKFDAFAAAVQQQQQQQNGISIASALVKKVQQQLLPNNVNLSTVQSPPSPSAVAAAVATVTPLDLQTSNNKRKRKIDRPSQKRIRGSYKLVSPEQKVMIHEYAEKHGVKAASKLFQVAPSTIASWLYQKPNGERTSAIRNKEAHAKILEWIQTRHESGERVNNRDFHSFALATMRELTGNPDFAASRSWCSNFLKKYNVQLDSDKQADSSSVQFRFDSVDENASESSQCYLNEGSPTEMLTDDEENVRDGVGSPQTNSPTEFHLNQQTTNSIEPFSPTQNPTSNGTDELSPSAELRSSSPTKNLLGFNLTAATSSNASKRLNGTLNRLLQSAVNRPNGHNYLHLLNGSSSSSSPSASSSTNTNIMFDSTGKEPKLTAEINTQAIETFVQHFESSFNTMSYFQEKLQQLLVNITQERDNYRTMYLREHDRRLQAESRLKESNTTSLV